VEASAGILTNPHQRVAAKTSQIPWFALAAIFGSTSIIVGGQWDISWHMTIGRDTFWTPAHMAIYIGGVVPGIASAWVVLRSTIGNQAARAAQGVRLWGFTGPLGAFLCIWGALAMLTSAPFDDWWHNAYGLDTEILSPPHVVLALGIAAIQFGAMIVAVALQNRNEYEAPGTTVHTADHPNGLRLMFVYAAGMLLTNAGVMTWTYMQRTFMHSSIYYKVGCAVLPLFLVAAARASRLRWPATATAGVYMAMSVAMMWIVQLFPAEPKLGPVRQHVTHMIPLEFPVLLIVPAIGIDLVMRRFGHGKDWALSVALGLVFFAFLLAVQWPFGDFLMSPYSRNYIFATDRFGYYVSTGSYLFRHLFYPWDDSTSRLIVGLLLSIPLAIASSRLGLSWGNWMGSVKR
jgi:hypothetical protein